MVNDIKHLECKCQVQFKLHVNRSLNVATKSKTAKTVLEQLYLTTFNLHKLHKFQVAKSRNGGF